MSFAAAAAAAWLSIPGEAIFHSFFKILTLVRFLDDSSEDNDAATASSAAAAAWEVFSTAPAGTLESHDQLPDVSNSDNSDADDESSAESDPGAAAAAYLQALQTSIPHGPYTAEDFSHVPDDLLQ
jgi:hypothetical protein